MHIGKLVISRMGNDDVEVPFIFTLGRLDQRHEDQRVFRLVGQYMCHEANRMVGLCRIEVFRICRSNTSNPAASPATLSCQGHPMAWF